MQAATALHPGLTRSRSRLLRRPSPAVLCFLMCLVLYLGAAGLVSALFAQRVLGGGDGVSRVEIANRILFSRDPHLAAIGFLWRPIPELALIPLVALKPLWPALVTQALAGSIVSAVFMAGASAALRGFLADLGIGTALGWTLTGAFALNPVVLIYAANGMSEAALLCFLLLTVRAVNHWLRTGSTAALAASGIYLALAYLTRYEAAAAACAVLLVVVVASLLRAHGSRSLRLQLALVDGLVAITPFAAAFVTWAAICWLITGTPLAQISGVYGNASQNAAIGVTGAHGLGQLITNLVQSLPTVLGMGAFLPVMAVAVLVVVVRRRDWAALGAPAILGAVFAFMWYAYVSRTFPPLVRYLIVDIPLTVVFAGVALAPAQPVKGMATAARVASRTAPHGPAVRAHQVARRHRQPGRALLFTATLVSVALTLGLGLRTVVAVPNSTADVAPVLHALITGTSLPAAAQPFAVDREVTQYLDPLRLPDGSVLLDDFLGFPIQVLSSDPQQFVVSSDRDFQQVLADPAGAGVRYVLVPPDTGLGTLDGVNRAYPGAYASGAGIGKLVRTFTDPSGEGANWRLYRVTPAA